MHIMKVFKRLGLRRKQKVKPDQPVQKNSTRQWDDIDKDLDKEKRKKEKKVEQYRLETETLERSQNPQTLSDEEEDHS